MSLGSATQVQDPTHRPRCCRLHAAAAVAPAQPPPDLTSPAGVPGAAVTPGVLASTATGFMEMGVVLGRRGTPKHSN